MSRPKWERQSVTIQTMVVFQEDGEESQRQVPHEVDAQVWGAFAIHEAVGNWAFDYTVTHIPTGRALVSGVGITAAKTFCREIAPILDWDTATHESRPGKDVIRVLRDARLKAIA